MKKTTSVSSRTIVARKVVLRHPQSGVYEVAPARLRIKGSLITEVTTCSDDEFSRQLKKWQAEDSQLECCDDSSLLSPSFINAHTHLAMSFFRGIDLAKHNQHNMVEDLFYALESHLQADDVRAFSRMGAYECLLSGTGFVWDHYYHGSSIAEALADTGLGGAVAPTLQDRAGPGSTAWAAQWEATEAINNNRGWKDKGIFAAFGPHATDTVSPALWEKISAAAATLSLPVHAHLAQSVEEWQRSQDDYGCSPTEFLRRHGVFAGEKGQLFAHGIFASREDLALLAGSGQTLVFCPFSAMIFAFPADVREWDAAGVSWVVATDCAASNDSMNVQKELRMVSGFPLQQLSYEGEYQKFLASGSSPLGLRALRGKLWEGSQQFRDPQYLLEKVWELPGRIHPQVKVGRLAPGYLANIVVWNENSAGIWPGNQLRTLAFGDTAMGIEQLMVAGQWRGKKGNFAGSIVHSPEYRDAQVEARRRFAELCGRAGVPF